MASHVANAPERWEPHTALSVMLHFSSAGRRETMATMASALVQRMSGPRCLVRFVL